MIKVGILFGGASREREVSFAGGRTVYDNLDKTLFEPVPLFVDSQNRFTLLNWEFIYKGNIRDFFPAIEDVPPSPHAYQVYVESLPEAGDLRSKIGKPVALEALPGLMDMAFLCLHGPLGEDGTLQGLLEWLGIPYTGSGIYPSALGINKIVQKKLQEKSGLPVPAWKALSREEWLQADPQEVLRKVSAVTGYPLVIKSANQGSSIGVSVLGEPDVERFRQQVDRSFFRIRLHRKEWEQADQVEWVRTMADIREGLGMPLLLEGTVIYHPETLLAQLRTLLTQQESVLLESQDPEREVIFEAFIKGREFSCIVIENTQGEPVALPPTEIVKGTEVFNYRSKYLPGLSRKETPIRVEPELLTTIRNACVNLYKALGFEVYARIDGFIADNSTIYLNDPNTTSGMMPSSFFFHQAAEIGLNPSQLLTYIISTSLRVRAQRTVNMGRALQLHQELESRLSTREKQQRSGKRVAVIMGGYSSERHISMESGRNIFEKLNASVKYHPFPVFLTGNDDAFRLFRLPVNLLLKDNADDIRKKVLQPEANPAIQAIIEDCRDIIRHYGEPDYAFEPRELSVEELAQQADAVFIALHGRPGEDGALQQHLIRFGLPFNGSGVASSQLTINKYISNNKLREAGMPVAGNYLVQKQEWRENSAALLDKIEQLLPYPLIAKPADDGCSTGVKKITDREGIIAFAELMFRTTEELDPQYAQKLKLGVGEELPAKDYFLLEELITPRQASHFLEVTVGLLTHYNPDDSLRYEVFEPSETLAEGGILSLEEKFLAGQGQNITPARFDRDAQRNKAISDQVRKDIEKAARLLQVEGYARIDAFVRIFTDGSVQTLIIEVNSLPGMTPATCIFHQCAINGYKPYDFIDRILEFGVQRNQLQKAIA